MQKGSGIRARQWDEEGEKKGDTRISQLTLSKVVFGWDDFGIKEMEGKEIGRKMCYFLCLVEGKSQEGKNKQCTAI